MKLEEIQQLQPELVERFTQILEHKQLSHAYLFTGSFASFEMALLLAQGVWPCGKCRSCRLIAEEEFSDVKIVRPVNQIIKTDRIRSLVQDFSQSGFEGSRQVFIVQDADKMHTNAANSLLKVMEEPQSEIYLFLLTSDENLILPTIKSRAQQVHFPKKQAYLTELLEKEGLIKSQANLVARFSFSLEEAEQQKKNATFFELAKVCDQFIERCQSNLNRAYLEVTRLVSLADDKEKQSQSFRLMELALEEQLRLSRSQQLLEKLSLARTMWKANVSFQNALEYMVLSLES
mgnify:CR=1 FL=1